MASSGTALPLPLRTFDTRWIGCWAGPRSGLDSVVAIRKMPAVPGIESRPHENKLTHFADPLVYMLRIKIISERVNILDIY
jgi:hypothetical protein